VEDVLRKCLQPAPGGVYVRIAVVHDCRRERDELALEGNELVLYTCEPEVPGRDNAALYRLLKREGGLHDGEVDIVHGARGRVKTVLIRRSEEEVLSILAKILREFQT